MTEMINFSRPYRIFWRVAAIIYTAGDLQIVTSSRARVTCGACGHAHVTRMTLFRKICVNARDIDPAPRRSRNRRLALGECSVSRVTLRDFASAFCNSPRRDIARRAITRITDVRRYVSSLCRDVLVRPLARPLVNRIKCSPFIRYGPGVRRFDACARIYLYIMFLLGLSSARPLDRTLFGIGRD